MHNGNHANRFQASQAAQIMGREVITVARLGQVIAPERPGHGVELDWKALEKVKA